MQIRICRWSLSALARIKPHCIGARHKRAFGSCSWWGGHQIQVVDLLSPLPVVVLEQPFPSDCSPSYLQVQVQVPSWLSASQPASSLEGFPSQLDAVVNKESQWSLQHPASTT